MENDRDLLRRYALERSEEAFNTLVNRHLGLVYHTARRSLGGDSHLAEDIAQSVFADLARKSPRLVRHPSLVAWLHRSTRLAARYASRTDARRHQREVEAQFMNQINASENEPLDWEQLSPIIDEALETLPATDREAVLLRFFEALDYPEMGRRLRLSADGARSRVDRALDRMHGLLTRRGITSSVAALSVTLTAHAAGLVPNTLAATIAGGVAQSTSTGGGLIATFLMSSNYTKMASGVAFLALAGAFAWYEYDWAVAMQESGLPNPAQPALAAMPVLTATSATATPAPLSDGKTVTVLAPTPQRSLPPPTLVPTTPLQVSSLNYSGYATPANALLTEAWAAYNGSVDARAASLTFSEENRPWAETLWQELPLDIRSRVPTPEHMVAYALAVSEARAQLYVVSQQLLRQTVLDSDRVSIQLTRGFNLVPENTVAITLQQGVDGNWRRVLPDSLIQRLARDPEGIVQNLRDYFTERPPAPAER